MRVNVEALRQQAWRSDKLYAALLAYARSIGCTVTDDEIISSHNQARKLAKWWMEHHTT